jgi:hypothetical protein
MQEVDCFCKDRHGGLETAAKVGDGEIRDIVVVQLYARWTLKGRRESKEVQCVI